LHHSDQIAFTLLGNAVKHFSTDFVRAALALPVVCHPITGYDTGKASATQDIYFCQKAAENASQRSPSRRKHWWTRDNVALSN
jgi:hypothetical protein